MILVPVQLINDATNNEATIKYKAIEKGVRVVLWFIIVASIIGKSFWRDFFISQKRRYWDMSDEMSGIQQSKFIADYLRISYP
jgi:hypothetical protein